MAAAFLGALHRAGICGREAAISAPTTLASNFQITMPFSPCAAKLPCVCSTASTRLAVARPPRPAPPQGPTCQCEATRRAAAQHDATVTESTQTNARLWSARPGESLCSAISYSSNRALLAGFERPCSPLSSSSPFSSLHARMFPVTAPSAVWHAYPCQVASLTVN